MAKMKIHELSKEIGASNKEVIAFLNENGNPVSSHLNSIGDADIEKVRHHFGKGAQVAAPVKETKPEPVKEAPIKTEKPQPMKQPQQPQQSQPSNPPRRMMDGPQDRRPMTNVQKPVNNQPVRHMADGPRDQQPRHMADGPRPNLNKNNNFNNNRNQNNNNRNNQNNNNRNNNNRNQGKTHVINGVVISSDDGNRLMRGNQISAAEQEKIRQQKIKEAQERREMERIEEERKAAERAAENAALAEKVKAEHAAIAQNIAERNAAEERKAAELNSKTEAAKTPEVKPMANDIPVVKSNSETEPQPEKKFKTVGGGVVRPTIVSRGPVNPAYRPNNGQNGQNGQRQGNNGQFNKNDRNGQRQVNGNGYRNDRNNDRNDRNNDPNRHVQVVDSRYNGDNKGHSNLSDRPNKNGQGSFSQDRNDRNNKFGNKPNGGFNGNRNGGFGGNNFGGGKDDDERKPVSHARDPKKKSAAPEIATELKNNNNRKNNKSKDKERESKRFGDFEEEFGSKKKNAKDPNRAGAFHRPEPVKKEVVEETIKTITLPDNLTISELADKMKIKSSDIVKKLFMAGKMVTVNSDITFEEAENIAIDYEIICEHEEKVDRVAELIKEADEDAEKMIKRPPVVCVMGHVDHGKTSLLDAIRTTSVTSREAGGITQHIGAYTVTANGESITFLDTPGHEAFTAMRMRGANSTDIAILVVAADDGVMPQTVEAINHAKAAGVELIVAVNKIDKPAANIERVKQELTEYNLVPEDWGGSTVFVPVSAKSHEGIDKLLEMVLLTADVLELKANPDRAARGLVIDAKLDKGRGPVATVLVQKGTLKVGDNVVIGASLGKVRALINDKGEKVKTAGPSTPVEILGLNSVPDAGEIVIATASEKEARTISEAYIAQNKEKLIAETKSKMSLDGLFSQIQAGNIKELNIIVKADVQGSVEAIKQSLLKLSNDEVAVRIIHAGVGAINESDATLASASNAIIIGFNVKPDNTAKDICEREKVDLRLYNVIYNAIDDVEAAMKGLLDPVFEEQITGHAEVRQLFKASGVGIIAGSYVLDGKVVRGSKARITRGKDQIFDGNLASLKRFKDDVKEVAAGYECGLVFEKFTDLQEGDQVEFYAMVEVPRK